MSIIVKIVANQQKKKFLRKKSLKKLKEALENNSIEVGLLGELS